MFSFLDRRRAISEITRELKQENDDIRRFLDERKKREYKSLAPTPITENDPEGSKDSIRKKMS